ncbi:hypothetical protein E2C01_085735 [Portunus trituberculatus]|uniref:Uncharacterized protein n=1 Tax=Portunus trituberculatus TaxID=210409 RepID=A0A5B7JCQ9_PORTR|nr:hypothetical protein [Portunus trituberculatus]
MMLAPISRLAQASFPRPSSASFIFIHLPSKSSSLLNSASRSPFTVTPRNCSHRTPVTW